MIHLFKQALVSLLLLVVSIICHAQPNSNYYQDFVLANHKIYVFYADGVLKIFDDSSGKLLDTYSPNPKIRLLTQDHNGSVVIADSANQVKRLNTENKWVPIAYYQGALYKVVFDNDNDCFLITDKGILDVKTQKIYMPGKQLYHSEWALRGANAWESEDGKNSTYMDDENDLWVAFGHGEWGTDMFIWNTKDFNFIPLTTWIAMPSYEANGHLFAVTGNFHDEYLVQYDKVYDQNKKLTEFTGLEVYGTEKDLTYQAAKDSHNKSFDPIKITSVDLYNFYIGGFTFKPSKREFYIITSEGLLTADHLDRNIKFGDLTPIKTFIFPKGITKGYEYYSHEKHEVNFQNHFPQYISKLRFTKKGNLVMLAPWNGVWLFDGEKLTIME